MNVTSENVFNNPKFDEKTDIIKNTRLEHDKNYGDKYCRESLVRCNLKLFDKIKNKTKIITIKHYHIPYGKNKTKIASQGRYERIQPNKLIFVKEGNLSKKVINTYMKCNNFPILWGKLFLKIANNRDYINSFCNRPYSRLHQHCRDWYFYNLIQKTQKWITITISITTSFWTKRTLMMMITITFLSTSKKNLHYLYSVIYGVTKMKLKLYLGIISIKWL